MRWFIFRMLWCRLRYWYARLVLLQYNAIGGWGYAKIDGFTAVDLRATIVVSDIEEREWRGSGSAFDMAQVELQQVRRALVADLTKRVWEHVQFRVSWPASGFQTVHEARLIVGRKFKS